MKCMLKSDQQIDQNWFHIVILFGCGFNLCLHLCKRVTKRIEVHHKTNHSLFQYLIPKERK
jgi:hypothetical protein